MARKSAALVTHTPPVGTEDRYARFLKACALVDKQDKEIDRLGAIVDAKGYLHPKWKDFQNALDVGRRLVIAAFGALDTYTYTVEHLNDPVGVPEEEIRAIVISSLNDKLDGLTFSKNTGLLGSSIAQAIRHLVKEESAGDPIFCEDCA